MEAIINEIKKLQISDATARLIACQRCTDELYSHIMIALKQMYSESDCEEMMAESCLKPFLDVERAISKFIAESITINMENTEMKAI